RLGPERPERIMSRGEQDLRARDITELRQVVVAEDPGGDPPGRVDVDVLVQRGPQGLGDAALDLAPALPWIDHRARVGRLHAAQDPDLAGGRPDRHPETLHVERHRAWPA